MNKTRPAEKVYHYIRVAKRILESLCTVLFYFIVQDNKFSCFFTFLPDWNIWKYILKFQKYFGSIAILWKLDSDHYHYKSIGCLILCGVMSWNRKMRQTGRQPILTVSRVHNILEFYLRWILIIRLSLTSRNYFWQKLMNVTCLVQPSLNHSNR